MHCTRRILRNQNETHKCAGMLRRCSQTAQQHQQQSTNILLCPGQSSQYLGMLKRAHICNEKLQNMIGTANDTLGFDIVDICENGPIETLNRTVYCQPAVVLSSILAFEKLVEDNALRQQQEQQQQQQQQQLLGISAVAGYSVGEVSALYMSGKLSYEDTITFVKERALAMDYASNIIPSGMCSLQGLPLPEVEQLCSDLTNEANDPQHTLSIAIQQFPNAVTLGGSHTLLNRVLNRQHSLLRETRDEKRGSIVKAEKVSVSGAFHTDYMKPAQEKVHQVLQKLNLDKKAMNSVRSPSLSNFSPSTGSMNYTECSNSSADVLLETYPFSDSSIDLYCNVTGLPYQPNESISELLVRQLCEPVRWSSVMMDIKERYLHRDELKVFEVGPGKQLKAIASRIDRRFVRKTQNITLE